MDPSCQSGGVFHPEFEYVFVKVGEEVFIIAQSLVESVAKACAFRLIRLLAPEKDTRDSRLWDTAAFDDRTVARFTGGLRHARSRHRLCSHCSRPRTRRLGLVLAHNASATAGERLEILAPVDNAGPFTEIVKDFAGQHVFKANPGIVESLKASGRLLGHGSITHSYPHCGVVRIQSFFARLNNGLFRRRPITCGKRRWNRSNTR